MKKMGKYMSALTRFPLWLREKALSSRPKRFLFYTLVGLVIYMVQSTILDNWNDIVGFLMGQPNFYWDKQPDILKKINGIIGYAPWFIIGILFIVEAKQRFEIHRTLGILLGFCAGWVIFIAIFIGRPIYSDLIQRRSFDPVLWRNSEKVYKDPYPRLRMVDSLLRRHELVDMPIGKIEELLGKPDPKPYYKPRGYEWIYFLGPERSVFSIDNEWLCIHFVDGRVKNVGILTD